MCQRLRIDPIVNPVNGSGGPPSGCQDEYKSGLMDAIGCFTVLDDQSQIPSPEFAMLCPGFLADPCRHASSARLNSAHLAGPCNFSLWCKVPYTLLPVMSESTVRVNGIDITPDVGTHFVLDVQDGNMADASAQANMLDDYLPLGDQQWLIGTFNSATGDVPILDTDLNPLIAHDSVLQSFLDLGGFQVSGTATVDWTQYQSNIGASVELPGSFTDPGGKRLWNQITLTADDKNGLMLDDVLLQVPSANFGALRFDNLAFCFQRHLDEGYCQRKTGADFGGLDSSGQSSWNATAEVSLPGTDIQAIPPPSDQGIGFVSSPCPKGQGGGSLSCANFDFAGLTASFDPAVPLGNSGVNLQSIGAQLGLKPLNFRGTIGLTAGGIVTINGAMFMVFATPSQPYRFDGSELNDNPTLPVTPTVRSAAVAVGGDVGLNLPVIGNTDLAGGYALYAYPSYLAAGGDIHLNVLGGALKLDGGVNGEFAVNKGAFSVEGNLQIHALFLDIGANAVISSKGVGACGSYGLPFGINVSAGMGYQWGGNVNAWVGSCDLSPYRVAISGSSPAAVAAGGKLRIPAGLPNVMVKLSGMNGAPDIKITGPGGVHASTDGDTKAASKPFVIYRIASQDTTYIAIIKPPAGVYTITANHGSPAITRVFTAHGMKAPTVSAQVIRRHGALVLRFADTAHPGQRVIFFERQKDGALWQIGQTTAADGTIRFTPGPGPAGTRQITAEVVQNGSPSFLQSRHGRHDVVQLALTSYQAPGPRELGSVTRLRARHLGSQLLIAFARVPGATGYAVTITLSGGQHILDAVAKPSLVLRGVFGEMTGKVTVQALGNNATNRNGPAASIRFGKIKGG